MQTTWNRIETQLQHFAPSIRQSLRPGASEVALQQVESFLPITLPQEVKILYRIHDGQADRTYRGECTGLVNGWSFLPLKEMCSTWLIQGNDLGPPGSYYNSNFACPTGERYPAYWHPHWLPFMRSAFGPQYCIDLAPGPHGRMGQILFSNDRDTDYPDPLSPGRSSIRVVAPSVGEFFATLANDLEAGIYAFDEVTDMLWSQEMLSALSVREANIYGFDEETGEMWQGNDLEALVRERQQQRKEATPVFDEPTWEGLSREHPLRHP